MKSPIDMMLDGVQWRPIPQELRPGTHDGLPVATHKGELKLALPGARGELSLPVYQLSDGRRVISEEGVQKFLRWLAGE